MKIPAPNTPASPVPELNAPTNLLGNPLSSPSKVDSPREDAQP